MSNILFLPRNDSHRNIYKGVSKYLDQKHQIFILSEKINLKYSKNITFISYENKVLENIKIIKEKDYKKFFSNNFNDINKNNFLFYEREFNYFPEYFNYKRFDYEYQCKYFHSLYIVLNKILNDYKIDLIFSELLTSLLDAVIYDLSKQLNIKFLSMRPSKISNGTVFCRPMNDTPLNLGMDKFKIKINESDKIIRNIKNMSFKYPQYMELTKKDFKIISFSRIIYFIKRLKNRNYFHNKIGIYRYPLLNPLRYFLQKSKNKFSFKFTKKYFVNFENLKNTDYIFFPLHYEPESSTAVRAFDWGEQLSLIKLLCRQIPPPICLVIKDHKGNDGFRKNSFYKTLSYLPNVKLVHKNVNPYELIKFSKGVICLTGRIGFESYILNKKVFLFGDVFYENWPHVTKISSLKQFKKWVVSLISQKNESHSESEIKYHIQKYLKNVYDFKFVIGSNMSLQEKNLKKMASILNLIISQR